MILPVLAVVLAFASQINAVCYVSNSFCKDGIRTQSDCSISCKVNSLCTSELTYVSVDTVGRLLVKAVPDLKESAVFFNTTLLTTSWQEFKIKIYRTESPEIAVCRTYTNNGPLRSPSNFEIKIHDSSSPYSIYEGKKVILHYVITSSEDQIYGKLVFLAPSLERITTSQLSNLELFNYVDDSQEKLLKLNILTPPATLRIEKYDIEVWMDKDTKVSNVTQKALGERIVYTYNVAEDKEDYFFIVTPNTTACKSNGCYRTQSATTKDEFHSANWILWVILLVVVAILFIIGIVLFCCCREHL